MREIKQRTQVIGFWPRRCRLMTKMNPGQRHCPPPLSSQGWHHCGGIAARLRRTAKPGGFLFCICHVCGVLLRRSQGIPWVEIPVRNSRLSIEGIVTAAFALRSRGRKEVIFLSHSIALKGMIHDCVDPLDS